MPRLERLSEATADSWIKMLESASLAGSGPEYVAEQARFLGLPTRMARSELHVVKPHQKVLELPGTGGDALDDLVAEHEEHDGEHERGPDGGQVNHPARDQVGPDLRRHPERRLDTAHRR